MKCLANHRHPVSLLLLVIAAFLCQACAEPARTAAEMITVASSASASTRSASTRQAAATAATPANAASTTPTTSAATTVGATSTAGVSSSVETPIQHVVVIVQENHTFDNYFGTFPGANGLSLNQLHQCQGYDSAADYHCQYTEQQLPYYWQLARAYGLSDNYFTAVYGPSFPNHFMLLTAQAPILTDPSQGWSCPEVCFDMPSLPGELASASKTWQIYSEPGSFDPAHAIKALYDQRQAHPYRSYPQLYDDIAKGDLPNVAWIKPPLADSEHPGYDIRTGQAWVQKIVGALQASPEWPTTAVFITWDDFGSLYDHVLPPAAEALTGVNGRTADRFGPRVPLLVVGPQVRHGYLSHVFASHLSIDRFIERVYGLPPLNQRDATSSDLFDFFTFDPAVTTPPAPKASVKANLLLNPSIEALPQVQAPAQADTKVLPAGWGGYHLHGHDVQDCTAAHSGKCSFEIVGEQAKAKTIFQQCVQCVGGKGDTYEVSGWSMAHDAIGGKYQLVCIVTDGSGQQLDKAVQFDAGTHDWQQVTFRVTTTGPYAGVTVYGQYVASSGTVWFDDFSLTHVG